MRTEQIVKSTYPALFDKQSYDPTEARDDHGKWTTVKSSSGGRGAAGQGTLPDSMIGNPRDLGVQSQKMSTLGGHYIITYGEKEHPHSVSGAGIGGHPTTSNKDSPFDLTFDRSHGVGRDRSFTTDIATAKHVGVDDDPRSPFHGEAMYTLHDASGKQMKFDHRGKAQEKFTASGAVAALARYHKGNAK